MSIIEDTIKAIMASLEPMEVGDYDEVLLGRHLLENAPPLSVFLEREPDTSPCLESDLDLDSDWGSRYPSILLGCYFPMKSPGTLVLFKNNLAGFYRSLLAAILPQARYLSRADIEAGARLITLGTYYHERFHHDCDLLRNLFGSGMFDPLIEEALAVAYERLCLAADRKEPRNRLSRMNGHFYALLMRQGYAFTSPGYRDWLQYADEVRFADGLLTYLQPGNHHKLQMNGIAVGEFLSGMLGKSRGGLLEKAI